MADDAVLITFWVIGFVAVTAASTTRWTAGSGFTAGADGSVDVGIRLCHTGCTVPHVAAIVPACLSSSRCNW